MDKHKFWCILAEIDPLYDVIRGNKNPQNEFFGPKSHIFQPISIKLCTVVKNWKTKILVHFGRNWPPLWRHQGCQKRKKWVFWTQFWHFSTNLKKNLAKLLRIEKHKFWCILAEIEPPQWRHNGGLKCPKITFYDLNWPFSSQSQWNVANMLRM